MTNWQRTVTSATVVILAWCYASVFEQVRLLLLLELIMLFRTWCAGMSLNDRYAVFVT